MRKIIGIGFALLMVTIIISAIVMGGFHNSGSVAIGFGVGLSYAIYIYKRK